MNTLICDFFLSCFFRFLMIIFALQTRSSSSQVSLDYKFHFQFLAEMIFFFFNTSRAAVQPDTPLSTLPKKAVIKRYLLWALSRSLWPRGLRSRSAADRQLRSWVRIPPGVWMSVCCECCVLSGRGLCDELITRPGESYRLWCIVVCDLETSRMRRSWPALGHSTTKKMVWALTWTLKVHRYPTSVLWICCFLLRPLQQYKLVEPWLLRRLSMMNLIKVKGIDLGAF